MVINDLLDLVASYNARLFADDRLLYRVVNTNTGQLQRKEDIHQLEKCETTCQTSFDANKCFTLHISKKRKPTEYNYLLHNQVREATKDSKYLGVTISNDLSWANHISNITAKSNRTIGFLRRNIYMHVRKKLKKLHTQHYM